MRADTGVSNGTVSGVANEKRAGRGHAARCGKADLRPKVHSRRQRKKAGAHLDDRTKGEVGWIR